MSEKSFGVEKPAEKVPTNYHEELLKIINDIEVQVRSVNPDPILHNELHEKRYMDARREVAEFESVRRDVCESFGVPQDDEHIFIYKGGEVGEQRSLRVFYVLIDTLSGQAFYGEGRIDHNTLLNNLIGKLHAIDSVSDLDLVVAKINAEPPQCLVFKGFISTKEFEELSESSRRVLETPIHDANGNRIDTPKTWFVTGHNIPEKRESE